MWSQSAAEPYPRIRDFAVGRRSTMRRAMSNSRLVSAATTPLPAGAVGCVVGGCGGRAGGALVRRRRDSAPLRAVRTRRLPLRASRGRGRLLVALSPRPASTRAVPASSGRAGSICDFGRWERECGGARGVAGIERDGCERAVGPGAGHPCGVGGEPNGRVRRGRLGDARAASRSRARRELGLHVGEYGEDAPVVVLAGGEAQLVEDRAHVLLHGGLRDDQALSDRLI
jgi:hypothetical protein